MVYISFSPNASYNQYKVVIKNTLKSVSFLYFFFAKSYVICYMKSWISWNVKCSYCQVMNGRTWSIPLTFQVLFHKNKCLCPSVLYKTLQDIPSDHKISHIIQSSWLSSTTFEQLVLKILPPWRDLSSLTHTHYIL